MGIIRNGILGGFRNKVGNIVGSSWRTLDVIKAYPKASKKEKTQAQLDQQARFKIVSTIITDLAEVINVGFKAYGNVVTPRNAAFKVNMQYVTGLSPNFSFNYELLQFSKGSLNSGRDVVVSTIAGSKLKFAWSNDFEDPRESGTDMATLVVYSPELDKWVTLINAAPRSAKQYTLQMPASFMGHEVMCYLSFASATKRLASNTLLIATLPAI